MHSFNTIQRRLLFLLSLLCLRSSPIRQSLAFRTAAPLLFTKLSTVAFYSRTNNHNADQIPLDGASTSLYTKMMKKANNTVKFKNIEEVLESFHEEPIGVFFGTKSCGPCQSMKEEMKRVHSTFGNELLLFHVDIDKWPSVATKLDVTMAPTLLVFQRGKLALRKEGTVSAKTLLQELKSILRE